MDAKTNGLIAEWTNDCSGKQDYDAELVCLSTRYWPRGGGFIVLDEQGVHGNESRPEIKPSAKASIMLQDREVAVFEVEDETEAKVKAAIERWAKRKFEQIESALLAALAKDGE